MRLKKEIKRIVPSEDGDYIAYIYNHIVYKGSFRDCEKELARLNAEDFEL